MKIMFDNTSGRNGTLEKWLVKKKKKDFNHQRLRQSK